MRVDLGGQVLVIQRSEVQRARSGQSQKERSADALFSENEENFPLEGRVYGPNGRFVNLRTETASAHLKSYVRDLLWQQAMALKDTNSGEAQASADDSGDWSPDKVTQRILDFAKRVAGDDPTIYPRLHEAAIKGFDEAKRIFGGWFPAPTEATLEQMTKGFEELKG